MEGPLEKRIEPLAKMIELIFYLGDTSTGWRKCRGKGHEADKQAEQGE